MKRLLIEIGVALVLCVSVVAWRSYVPHVPLPLDQAERVRQCEATQEGRLVHSDSATLELLQGINSLCYNEINEEDTLSEANIRRTALLNQQTELPILMWMVIAITLSGVALAGLQLLGAYQLAVAGRSSFEQGGQLTIESNKVSLHSSVTGLMILLISFAFFYIFVTQVYLVKAVNILPVQLPASQGNTLKLSPGGIGPPPQRPESNAAK